MALHLGVHIVSMSVLLAAIFVVSYMIRPKNIDTKTYVITPKVYYNPSDWQRYDYDEHLNGSHLGGHLGGHLLS